ncbi:MAG: alpha/beta fold hydrolase [Deltaproteobacteria bacterium]|nr:alpha/beta fold hydrolase [Deltaproteobacteria bacterium]
MTEPSSDDYTLLDHPDILMVLFHPRPEWRSSKDTAAGEDLLIPVDGETVVGARFHRADAAAPNILFFHGNGEIVADYDDLAQAYTRMTINFLPVDYRGYGRSTGQPSVSTMMRDCHVIFEFAVEWLAAHGYSGPLIIMGRSLGSASALELASRHQDHIQAVIVESGFARLSPLLRRLGLDLEALSFEEERVPSNVQKIAQVDKPTLVIHAEHDHIIPFSEGRALFEASPSADKTFLKIPGANHNDIFIRGFSEYMAAVKRLADRVM